MSFLDKIEQQQKMKELLVFNVGIISRSFREWNEYRLSNKYIKPYLKDADLSGLLLSEIKDKYEILEVITHDNGINLSEADLRGANFENAMLCGSDLIDANMKGANLRGVCLRDSLMPRVNLALADLSGADLRGAYLDDADMRFANLSGADLSGANLSWANLCGVNLSDANLNSVNLRNTVIRDCKLDMADFNDAVFENTVLVRLNLGRSKNLDKVRHLGQSTIDVGTIINSSKGLPKAFFLGCGIPEDLANFAYRYR